MGKIWLETTEGKLMHLPVVGDDINSPKDAVKIPTSVLTTENRCLSGQITVVSPTHGSVTFDFDPPGRTGDCDQCGQCCGHPVSNCPNPSICGYVLNTQYNWHVCQYLTIDPGANKLGKKNGSECSLRAVIFDMFKGCTTSPDKRESWMTHCPMVYPGE